MKRLNSSNHVWKQRSGVMLLEMVIALAIFGMTAVGLMGVLGASARLAVESQMELRMLLRLQSTLTEFSKVAQIQEGSMKSDPDETGVFTETVITKMEDLKNSEEQILNDMFHVKVTAFYDNFGRQAEVSAETIRYARLYQVTGGTQALPGAGTPPGQ